MRARSSGLQRRLVALESATTAKLATPIVLIAFDNEPDEVLLAKKFGPEGCPPGQHVIIVRFGDD